MSLAILTSHKNQVCLANPVTFFVHSEHVFKHELLPRQKWHFYDLTEMLDILQLVFAFEKWAVDSGFCCPSELLGSFG